MKLNRRNFLLVSTAGAAGGAVGSMFSPLSWKLMDDSSVWSQNWPWTPVPLDGEVSFEETTCALCPGGCRVKVRKVDSRPVKLEGVDGGPVNDGGICILGLTALQLVYGPARVRTPLKRAGKRGEGKWVEITWDEAISDVSEKLAELKGAGQSKAVGCITNGAKGVTSALFARFMEAYGSPNHYWQATAWDSYEENIQRTLGLNGSAGFDLEKADYILSFGAGLLDGWGSPVRMFQAHSKWRENHDAHVTLVQIDAQLSNTAAKADKWLPINPGTEGAVAMAMAHVIISKNLYDRGYVNWSTTGFRDFFRTVQTEYAPEKVAKIACPVQKPEYVKKWTEELESRAIAFAKAEKPLALAGKGNGDRPVSQAELNAIQSLNALVGSINREEGGMVVIPDADKYPWPPVVLDADAKGYKPALVTTKGRTKYGASNLLSNLPKAINAQHGGLKALLVAGANPLYTLADTEETAAALQKIEYIVSFASQMDDTFTYADIILPDHIYLESTVDVPTPPGFAKPVYGLAKPVIDPVYKTKAMGDSIIEIAKAMGGTIAESFPWGGFGDAMEQAMNEKWNALDSDGVYVNEDFQPEKEGIRFRFFARAGMEDRISLQGSVEKYPLVITPCDTIRLSTGALADTPFMVKTVSDTKLKKRELVVQVNTMTAQQYGFKEGSQAILETPVAKATVLVHCSEEIAPGLVGVPRGLGHIAYDEFVGGKGTNYNTLISPVQDPATGFDVAWGIRAKLT
ncbi:MAG: molybdopterin-dependent oxidoreductase [Desulfatibacillum sp.]|nr:molybdopterin-dependent oxidoreductase [Desulfatibacillum sp.]